MQRKPEPSYAWSEEKGCDDLPRFDPSEWLPCDNVMHEGFWLFKSVYKIGDKLFSIISPEPPNPITEDELLKRLKLRADEPVSVARKG